MTDTSTNGDDVNLVFNALRKSLPKHIDITQPELVDAAFAAVSALKKGKENDR